MHRGNRRLHRVAARWPAAQRLLHPRHAVAGAFSTIYGAASLTYFQVWAYQVARGTVGVGDPLDLSRRLDNQWAVQTETPYSVGPQ